MKRKGQLLERSDADFLGFSYFVGTSGDAWGGGLLGGFDPE